LSCLNKTLRGFWVLEKKDIGNTDIGAKKRDVKVGLTLLGMSVFVLICLIFRQFFVFDAIAYFISGLFGLMAYPFMFGLGLYGYFLTRQFRLSISRSKFVCAILGILFALLFLHILSTLYIFDSQPDFNSYLKLTYNMQTSVGGAVLGIISFGFAKLMGTVVSLVVLGLAFLACSYVFSDYGKNIKFFKHKTPQQSPKFVKGTVQTAQRVVPQVQNSLYVADILKTPTNQAYLNNYNASQQMQEKFLPIQMQRQDIVMSSQYNELLHDNYKNEILEPTQNLFVPTNPIYNPLVVDNRTQAHQLLFGNNQSLYPSAGSLNNNSLNYNNTSSLGLYGNPNTNSIYQKNNLSLNNYSSTTGYKPPKLSTPIKVSPLKTFSFPPTPNLEQKFVPGEIINGDTVAKDYDSSYKPKSQSKIKDEIVEKSNTLPPIMNGELFGTTLSNAKKDKYNVDLNKDDIGISNSTLPPIVQASQFVSPKKHTTIEPAKKKLDSKLLYADDILDEVTYPTVESSSQSSIVVKESSKTSKFQSSKSVVEDDIVDFVNSEYVKDDTKDNFVFDNTGYYVYNHQNQDTQSILDTPVDVNTSIELDSKNSNVKSSNTIKNNQINLEDYEIKSIKKPIRARKYIKPNLNLLANNSTDIADFGKDSDIKGEILLDTLKSFGLDATIKEIACGPAVTRFELEMPPGIPIKSIDKYTNDLAYNLESNGSIRIEMPIPGKKAVGVEVPNSKIGIVGLKEILDSKEFKSASSPLTLALGKDISGQVVIANLEKMPHLLIAGATGSGKSACINSIIASILFKASPEDVRLILIDPKRVELSIYSQLPHLIVKDIVTEPAQAINALNWSINEMERRYKLMIPHKARNICEFNDCKAVQDGTEPKLPFIVIIIDELADLMMSNKRDVEDKIRTLTQKSRAAGIHLIVATQRPSVDVITGTIKANLPSRIAFSVTNMVDSRTILDTGGAESLLGRGDMLYNPIDYNSPKRIQGAFITSAEVASVVDYCKEHNVAKFEENIEKEIMYVKEPNSIDPDDLDLDDTDPLLPEVAKKIVETGNASATMVQRYFRVGYSRASRVIDQMEMRGYIGPLDPSSRMREVKITKEIYEADFGSVE